MVFAVLAILLKKRNRNEAVESFPLAKVVERITLITAVLFLILLAAA